MAEWSNAPDSKSVEFVHLPQHSSNIFVFLPLHIDCTILTLGSIISTNENDV
jgi:hypothetical protein